jgi:hypothetical protein
LLQYWTIKAWRTNVAGKTDWTTADPSLHDGKAPHETRASVRMHRNGWPGLKIMERLNLRGSELMSSMQAGLDEEGDAHRAHRPIHDAAAPRGAV